MTGAMWSALWQWACAIGLLSVAGFVVAFLVGYVVTSVNE